MRHNFSESRIQEIFIKQARLLFPKALIVGGFAGEKMSLLQAVRRKRMGYIAGFPDVFIIEPRKSYSGLFIEFKSEKGRQSDSQKSMQKMLEERGYRYIVVNSVPLAIDELSKYLRG